MTLQKAKLSERVADTHHGDCNDSEELDAGISVAGRSFRQDFVLTTELEQLAVRAMRYLDARIPVHFRGRAGCGKTALSLFLAHELGRPVHFVSGDAMRTTESLIGQETGVKTKHIVDRYVHSVRKVEQETSINWRADALTQAALGGGTLVYDEFTRSPAEANNALLSVLEEGVLMLPAAAGQGGYAPVHADFRVIFTSNSAEYAGVQAPQDALIDRMITFDLDELSAETETAIVANRSGAAHAVAGKIVGLVRDYRQSGAFKQVPTMRASLMIAEVTRQAGLSPCEDDDGFCDLVLDVLLSKGGDTAKPGEQERLKEALLKLISVHCPAAKLAKSA